MDGMSNLLRLGTLACACLLASAAEHNRLSPAEKSAGWRLLFDGTSFAGWEDPTKKTPPPGSFTIEDGCLKAEAKPRITEDLFTGATFADFELAFDWKIAPGGNSGIKYRIQDRVFLAPGWTGRFEDLVNQSVKNRPSGRPQSGQEYVIGFEYQLLDDATNADARNGTTHQSGALYDMVAPSSHASHPAGEWNQSRLVVRGEHVEHWMNGVKVVDARLDAPEIATHTQARWGRGTPVYELLVKHPRRTCQLSLQNHDSAAWFRNIKLRPL